MASTRNGTKSARKDIADDTANMADDLQALKGDFVQLKDDMMRFARGGIDNIVSSADSGVKNVGSKVKERPVSSILAAAAAGAAIGFFLSRRRQ